MAKTYGNFTDFVDFSRASGGTALRRVSYGAELVTNGTFDTDTSEWTVSGGASPTSSVSSGQVVVTATQTGSIVFEQTSTQFEAGKLYQIKVDVIATTDNIDVWNKASSSISIKGLTTGTNVINYLATDNGYLRIGNLGSVFTSGEGFTLDNISVKEVTFDQSSGDLVLFNHPNNIPRVEYDSNGTVKGLLIEEQRTNLVTGSDASGWGPSGSATLTDQTDLSLGIFTGVRVASGGATWHRVNQTNLSVTSGVAYACTIFYKAGTSGKVFMNLRDNTNTTEARIGGVIGSCTVLQEYAGTAELLSEELIGDGVYRMQVKFTPNATITSLSFGAGPYSDTAGEDVIILGGQLEQGSFATSYIPTTGATATRSADIASIDVANFGYNKKAGTMVVEASSFGVVSGTTNRFLCFNNGTSAERMNLFVESNSALMFYVADGYVAQAALNSGETATNNVVFNVSGAYKQNNFAVSANGSSAVTDTSGTLPAITQVQIGSELNALPLNGHIKSIKYLPRRLTNTQLQEQSA